MGTHKRIPGSIHTAAKDFLNYITELEIYIEGCHRSAWSHWPDKLETQVNYYLPVSGLSNGSRNNS